MFFLSDFICLTFVFVLFFPSRPEHQACKHAPYGQGPLLKLANFSARYGLAGSSDVEAALINGAFEHISDIRRAHYAIKSDAEKVKVFFSTELPDKIALFEKNVQGATFIGKSNKVSYADVALYYLRFVLASDNKEGVDAAFAACPKVSAAADAVEKDEKIVAYIAARKDTKY